MAGFENPYRYYESLDPKNAIHMHVVRSEPVPSVLSKLNARKAVEVKKKLIAVETLQKIIGDEYIDLDTFLSGTGGPLTYEYDRTRIEPYMIFGDEIGLYEFISSAMDIGIKALKPEGVIDQYLDAHGLQIKYSGATDLEDANRVNIFALVTPI